jgi:O-antigen/teichoic acid export membrane protein
LERKGKLISDISASGLQTLLNQFISLIIFYFTSRYLSKIDFGNFNWANAIGATIIAVASLGLDLVVVKHIATSKKVPIVVGIHLFHTLFGGLSMVLILTAGVFIFPSLALHDYLFLLVFINLIIANIANTFKLSLNGQELYKQLAIITISSNVVKLVGVILVFMLGFFSLKQILAIYILASFFEMALAYYFANTYSKKMIVPLMDLASYKELIKESMPQFAVVLFDSALARVDWIILGFVGTALATAEYSFAYRIFELARLPILIVAPILLTRFSKMLINQVQLNEKQVSEINLFLKFGIFVSLLIPIALVSAWSQLIDDFTNEKYNEKDLVLFNYLSRYNVLSLMGLSSLQQLLEHSITLFRKHTSKMKSFPKSLLLLSSCLIMPVQRSTESERFIRLNIRSILLIGNWPERQI